MAVPEEQPDQGNVPQIVPAPPNAGMLPVLRKKDGSIDAVGTLAQRLAVTPPEDIPNIIEAMGKLREQEERERDGRATRIRGMIDTVGNLTLSGGALAAGIFLAATFDDAPRQAVGVFLAGIGGFRVAAQFVLGYFRIPTGPGPQEDNQP